MIRGCPSQANTDREEDLKSWYFPSAFQKIYVALIHGLGLQKWIDDEFGNGLHIFFSIVNYVSEQKCLSGFLWYWEGLPLNNRYLIVIILLAK